MLFSPATLRCDSVRSCAGKADEEWMKDKRRLMNAGNGVSWGSAWRRKWRRDRTFHNSPETEMDSLLDSNRFECNLPT
jgi:hypothetical protein